jgi:hypothetical protein
VLSDRRKHGDVWVHEFELRAFKGELKLSAANDLLAFFRLLRPGSEILIDGRPFLSVDNLGQSAFGLSAAVEALERVCEALRLDLDQFSLADLKVEEFGHSLGFLDIFVLQNIPLERLAVPFVLGLSAEKDPGEIRTEPATVEVPIVVNLSNIGVAIWVTADASLYLGDDGRWCGLRIEKQRRWRHELVGRFDKSIDPEMWIRKMWPAINLADREFNVRTFSLKDCAHITLEAVVTKHD